MARYVIIALLSCFYVTGAVWFVQSQGQAYREELGRARQTEAGDSAIATGVAVQQPKLPAVNNITKSDTSPPSPEASTSAGASQTTVQTTSIESNAKPSGPPVQASGPAPAASAPLQAQLRRARPRKVLRVLRTLIRSGASRT